VPRILDNSTDQNLRIVCREVNVDSFEKWIRFAKKKNWFMPIFKNVWNFCSAVPLVVWVIINALFEVSLP
jgi:hypothetical protein